MAAAETFTPDPYDARAWPRAVLTKPTFINGALFYPGDEVAVDPRIFVAPEDTGPVSPKNANIRLLGPGEQPPLREQVAYAPIGPTSPAAAKSQVIPSGGIDTGNRIISGARVAGAEVTEAHQATFFNDRATLNAAQNRGEQMRASQEGDGVIQGEGGGTTAADIKAITDAHGLTGNGTADGEETAESRKSPYDKYTKAQLGDALEAANVEVPDAPQTKAQLVALADANADKVPLPA